jgi:hypothetical protein
VRCTCRRGTNSVDNSFVGEKTYLYRPLSKNKLELPAAPHTFVRCINRAGDLST